MTVVGAGRVGEWEATFHCLQGHPAVEVSAGMVWLCCIGRVEQIVAERFGVIGTIRAIAAEAFGADRDDALYGALCVWIDKGVRGDG